MTCLQTILLTLKLFLAVAVCGSAYRRLFPFLAWCLFVASAVFPRRRTLADGWQSEISCDGPRSGPARDRLLVDIWAWLLPHRQYVSAIATRGLTLETGAVACQVAIESGRDVVDEDGA